MIRAYRDASTYADAAQLRIVIDREGQNSGDTEPLNASVSFVRPNKVRIQCLDAMMVADGGKIRAAVSSVPRQVLELDAPARLGISNLYLGDAFDDSLSRGLGGFPIQLALLLDEDSLQALAPEGSSLSDLPSDTFDGHKCLRVKVEAPDGGRIYWIDAHSYVLRLVELPTDMLRRQMEAAEGPVKRVAVTLELLGARLNEPVPDVAFQFEVPSDAKLVKQLLRPPHPVSDMLGKPIGEFKFSGINGGPTSSQSSAGKVTVLEFWFTGCGPCRETFPQLAKVREKYKNSDRVAILGVSVDRPEVDDAKIQETAAAWGAGIPIARDTADDFQTAFHGLATPALFVVGPDGTVQYNEVGWNPALTTELPDEIDAILAGKSTWQEAKARGEQRLADYERKAQEPPAPFTTLEDLPATKIPPRDEPKSLKLSKTWDVAGLKAPGNFLIVESAGVEPKVFVMDGPRTVVELNHEGKIVARRELEIPEQAVISYLRTAVDRKGQRYYAGSGSGQQQLFLFDANWKLVLGFPSLEQGKHAGIGDVQFIDLEETGTPQLAVGYWGLVGVQAVSLEGKRLWTNRSMEFVLSMTQSGSDSKGIHNLLCTNSRGSLVPIDSTGAALPEWSIPGAMLETALAAELGRDGQKSICAIASNADGTPLAIGVGPHGEDQWRYVLPRGIFRTPVERLTAADLVADKRHWLMAGADGSIHFVAGDGTPLDHFHYGSAATGLAGVRFGDERRLLVSTAKALEAWRVEAK
ncbi:MAG TPA: TlpA disulfide reductase family protein [Pirellulales bacterium]|nr:TlpA disulfide reductase family protein [Pirellulales bacterium]